MSSFSTSLLFLQITATVQVLVCYLLCGQKGIYILIHLTCVQLSSLAESHSGWSHLLHALRNLETISEWFSGWYPGDWLSINYFTVSMNRVRKKKFSHDAQQSNLEKFLKGSSKLENFAGLRDQKHPKTTIVDI